MMPPSAARVAHAASVVATLCVIGVQVTTGFPGRGRRGASGIWCPQPMLAWDPALQLIATEGRGVWGDSGVPDNAPPPWLDKKRYAAGKAFVAAHPLAISYAHVHALYLLLTVPSVLDVLVYTRNSETPDKAFVRYLDTVNGVGAWYTTDMYKPGTVGHEQLKRVRWLHNLVRRDMNDQQAAHARNRTQLAGDFSDCRVSAGLRRDLAAVARSACPFALGKRDVDNNDLLSDGAVSPWMSQYDMSITQWAFVGPVIQFPEAYGIGNATAEELDGFVHLWEVIGYSLGIEDRFNFCQGGLRPTLRRSREALSGLVLPRLREASPRWEYMARCMADGLGYVLPGVGFKIQLANMMRLTLDAPSPSVEAMLTPLQRQSVQGYRGVMDSMRNDRNNVFGAPIAAAFKQIYPLLRNLPQEDVKKARHRSPYRRKGCSPDLAP